MINVCYALIFYFSQGWVLKLHILETLNFVPCLCRLRMYLHKDVKRNLVFLTLIFAHMPLLSQTLKVKSCPNSVRKYTKKTA